MNRGQALVPLLSICLSLSTSQARAQEDCSKFVVFDEASSYASEFYLKQTRDVFCRNTVSSRGQAVTAGYEAGIPVPVAEAVLKIDVAGHASPSDWSAWQDAFCKSQAGLEIASKVSLASTKTFGKNSSEKDGVMPVSNTGCLYFLIVWRVCLIISLNLKCRLMLKRSWPEENATPRFKIFTPLARLWTVQLSSAKRRKRVGILVYLEAACHPLAPDRFI